MRKRLIDTGIFQDNLIRNLPKEFKLIWVYLLLDCDHAGIWRGDFRILKIILEAPEIKESEVLDIFAGKIEKLNNGDLFIPGFVKFQYGLPLNLNVKPIFTAWKILQDRGLANRYPTVGVGVKNDLKGQESRGYLTPKDKDRDKDIDKDGDKDNEKSSIPAEIQKLPMADQIKWLASKNKV